MSRTLLATIASIATAAIAAACVVVPAGPPGHAKRGGPVVVAPAPVVITARPRMVFVTEFGVAFSPDLDVDVYEVGGIWYTFRSGLWYQADVYSGPWVVVEHRHLPKGLVKIKPGQVRKHYFEHEGKGKGKDRGRGRGNRADD